MQIHELNSFSGTPSANDYLVTDNGTDTSKIPATELIAPAVDAVADEVATRQSADALLQSQIDQLVAPTGTAPNPAEIENARIGADNVTYTTLGSAIRTQVSDLKADYIFPIKSDNYSATDNLIDFHFDANDWIQGRANSVGVGYAIYNKNKVNVTAGDKVYVAFKNLNYDLGTLYAVAYTYDSSDNFVSILDLKYKSDGVNEVTIPSGVSYFYVGFDTKSSSRPLTLATMQSIGALIYIGFTKIPVDYIYPKYVPLVDALKSELTEKADGINPLLELGNITYDTNGWTYNNSESGKRMRTPQGYSVHLNPLDMIILDDATYTFGCSCLNDYDGTYKSFSWQSKKMVSPYKGEYIILVRRTDSATLSESDKEYIIKNLRCYRQTNLDKKLIRNDVINFPIETYAHRGFTVLAPENTIESALLALEYGYKGVEVDALFTSDNVPVVFHDANVDNLLNGSGAVSSFTLEQLQALRFIGNNGINYPDAYVPTLDAMVKAIKKAGGYILLDLGGGKSQSQTEDIYYTIRDNGMLDRTIWASWYKDYLGIIKNLNDRVPLALTTYQSSLTSDVQSVIADALSVKTNYNRVIIYNQQADATTDAQIDAILDAGLDYGVWSYNTIPNPNDAVTFATSEGLSTFVYQGNI